MPETYDETLHHAASDTIDHVAEISDPGERNRENHLWGDRVVIGVGNLAAWLFPLLMVAIVAQVFLRKAGMNQAWLDDAQWWIYGTALLTGFGYAITTDSHVRVDIFHERFSNKKKARIEIIGLGWLLLPFLVMMTDILLHYAWSSFVSREGSDSPNGLHMLYLLKAMLPLLFGVAILATWFALKRNVMALTTPKLWHMLLAAFPAAWFVAERSIHYALWWFVRLTNADVISRKISRDPLLDYTVWYGLAIEITLFAISFLLTRKHPKKV